jgi:hypothetical protein
LITPLADVAIVLILPAAFIASCITEIDADTDPAFSFHCQLSPLIEYADAITPLADTLMFSPPLRAALSVFDIAFAIRWLSAIEFSSMFSS